MIGVDRGDGRTHDLALFERFIARGRSCVLGSSTFITLRQLVWLLGVIDQRPAFDDATCGHARALFDLLAIAVIRRPLAVVAWESQVQMSSRAPQNLARRLHDVAVYCRVLKRLRDKCMFTHLAFKHAHSLNGMDTNLRKRGGNFLHEAHHFVEDVSVALNFRHSCLIHEAMLDRSVGVGSDDLQKDIRKCH